MTNTQKTPKKAAVNIANLKKSLKALPSTPKTFGGRIVGIPNLTGPVGAATPETQKQYPKLNAKCDTDVIDYFLCQIAQAKQLGKSDRLRKAAQAASPIFSAIEKIANWADRNSTVAQLQSLLSITDPEGVKQGIVFPGSETLNTLAYYSDVIEELLLVGNPNAPRQTGDFLHNGAFDKSVFQAAYIEEFSHDPHYYPGCFPSLLKLLGMMEQDVSIPDIRWIAYMLATTYVEASSRATVPMPVLKKGQPVLDKAGNPTTKPQTFYPARFEPSRENAPDPRKNYSHPVKIKKLQDGTVRVTEQNGKQYIATQSGRWRPLSKGAIPERNHTGTKDGYKKDDGEELVYAGRGYVQLTWWYLYLSSGNDIGRGLDLLLDPDLAIQHEIAYTVMATGMRDGTSFANGNKFSKYFFGNATTLQDWKRARAMVNGSDRAEPIAKLAVKFMITLLKAKLQ